MRTVRLALLAVVCLHWAHGQTLTTTTLSAPVDANQTQIYLTSTAGVAARRMMLVEGELMIIRSVGSGYANVVRGAQSRVYEHPSAATVYIGTASQFVSAEPKGACSPNGLENIWISTTNRYTCTSGYWVQSTGLGSGGGGGASGFSELEGSPCDNSLLCSALAAKADASALAAKADTSTVNAALANKADTSALTSGLAGREPTITAGTTGQYWGWAKQWRSLATDVQAVTAGGDVSGPISSLSVTKIQGVAVDSTPPTDGQGLFFDFLVGKWKASAGLRPDANGDVTVPRNLIVGGSITSTDPNPYEADVKGTSTAPGSNAAATNRSIMFLSVGHATRPDGIYGKSNAGTINYGTLPLDTSTGAPILRAATVADSGGTPAASCWTATGAGGTLACAGYVPTRYSDLTGNLQSQSVAASTTSYIGFNSNSVNATEPARSVMVTHSGTLRNFYLRTNSTQQSDGGLTCTVRVQNTTDTPITLTVAASATAGLFSDTTHTQAVSAGDLVAIKCVNSSASASATIIAFSLGLGF